MFKIISDVDWTMRERRTMGSPLRLLLCLVAAKALNPKNKPQTQACVDEQGNAIECVQPDDGPGSLQDQFVEKVATARRLKGLEGEPAQPSMTQRKNAERKARQAMRRKRSGRSGRSTPGS